MSNYDWAYLHGQPQAEGILKAQNSDFKVTEVLGYEPCGEGEHIYLWLQKENLNTAFVAEQLAKFTGLPLRAVSYAGRKDKHAITTQWFGIHQPGKKDFDWSEFALEGVTIIKAIRHNKKLRTGVLKANTFELRLTELEDTEQLEQRLQLIRDKGVPNYFGEQRFGNNNSNLALGERMLEGEAIRNRNKRSMAISALRSALFNHFISARLKQNLYDTVLPGDALMLSGSGSFFINDGQDPTLAERLLEGDIQLSAPMWGKGHLATQEQGLAFEQQQADIHAPYCQGLENLGLKQERRAISLRPQDFQWHWQDENTLYLRFSLPAGCFATSVVREIMRIKETDNENTAE